MKGTYEENKPTAFNTPLCMKCEEKGGHLPSLRNNDSTVCMAFGSGTKLYLMPLESGQFKNQADDVNVFIRVGKTVFQNGTEALPGSCFLLETLRETKTYGMPMIAFAYETTGNGARKARNRIEDAGKNAILIFEGERCPVMTAWITKDMACYYFDSKGLPSAKPTFNVEDGNLIISFHE